MRIQADRDALRRGGVKARDTWYGWLTGETPQPWWLRLAGVAAFTSMTVRAFQERGARFGAVAVAVFGLLAFEGVGVVRVRTWTGLPRFLLAPASAALPFVCFALLFRQLSLLACAVLAAVLWLVIGAATAAGLWRRRSGRA